MPNKQQKRERDRQDVVLFFELIQIAIGNRAHLSFPPNNIQWNNAFTIASQQSLIGITFVGLNKIPKSQMPNELLILKWFGMTELLVNTDVEVHFRPWISHNLIRNYRLQKLSRKFGKKSFVVNKNNNLIVPAHLFNVVHVLHHIYWYFLVEGVGLRQVLDLYFLSINNRNSDIIVIIKQLSMFKFTSAVMWVLMEAFGFNKEFLPCKPNQKEGRFLLSEILKAGNLGHYDVRENHVIYESRISTFF